MNTPSFKQISLSFLFTFLCLTGYSNTYLRFNHTGYFSNEQKRLIICSDQSLNNTNWTITTNGNQILSGTIGATSINVSEYTAQGYNYEIFFSSLTDVGTYTFNINSENISQELEIKDNPYENIKFEVLKSLRARRSGSNDAIIHSASHLGDSSCYVWRNNGGGNDKTNYTQDENNLKVNALGGWYDAGDYIKFTLTNAYTTYHILKTYNLDIENNKLVKTFSTTDYNDLLDEAVFGLEYLEKMFPDESTFIIQVADETDHQEGTRLPENDDLDGQRKAYVAFAKPQMALTVAALALGSKTLAEYGNTEYATTLSQKAISLYETMQEKGINSAWYQKDHEVFYKDESYNDNLKLAAIELYNLTEESKYLADANSYNVSTSYWSSWGDLSSIASNTTIPHNSSETSKVTSSLDYFNTIAERENNIWKMPHSTTWGTLYSYFGVANTALSYQMETNDSEYKKMAIDVLDYTMGLNNWGKAFIISNLVENTIQNPYAQLYKLNPTVLAVGEIAEGPTTKSTHDANSEYFYPAHNPNGVDANFNTENLTFFDQSGDYVCMETTITGLSDGLFLFAQAENIFSTKTPTFIREKTSDDKSQGLILYPNPTSETLNIKFNDLEIERCSVFDINGNHVISIRPHNHNARSINITHWSAGKYTMVTFLKNGTTEMSSFEKI